MLWWAIISEPIFAHLGWLRICRRLLRKIICIWLIYPQRSYFLATRLADIDILTTVSTFFSIILICPNYRSFSHRLIPIVVCHQISSEDLPSLKLVWNCRGNQWLLTPGPCNNKYKKHTWWVKYLWWLISTLNWTSAYFSSDHRCQKFISHW